MVIASACAKYGKIFSFCATFGVLSGLTHMQTLINKAENVVAQMSLLRTRCITGFFCAFFCFLGSLFANADSALTSDAPVKIIDNGTTVTLQNGLLVATISKSNANMVSLTYRGVNLLQGGEAYWNVYGSTPTVGKPVKTQTKGTPSVFTITQDPDKNGGEMGEFELLFPYSGGKATPDASAGAPDTETVESVATAAPPVPLDIAIRYTLRRADSGLYGWTSVTHKPGYPAFDIEASTVCLKLDPQTFDHLTVDGQRNKQMISGNDWLHGEHLNLKEARRMTTGIHSGEVEHKYDYSAMFSQTPAFGWSSTQKQLGIWIVNPSQEYINGGPTRIDLTGHIDLKENALANPTLLMVWHSFHYGGNVLSIGQDEAFNKVVGPFLIYCNNGPTPDAMWKDALDRAAVEKKAWPYDWAKMPGYANAAERGAVTGKLMVSDPQQPSANSAHAWVGLAAAPYTGTDQANKPVQMTWEIDGKHYEYWSKADAEGNFTIKNARPGKYVLYAFNTGILGDFSRANVTVTGGQTLDLGTLNWTPVRFGKQLWDIGIADRSAGEFRHGDKPWVWGNYNFYRQDFPKDVNFIVGQSNYANDWNYAQPPVQEADGKWHGTTWTITFNMAQAGSGKATLRLALCGTRDTQIDVTVNGKPVGSTGLLPSSGVMHRDAIRANEVYSDIPFAGSDLVPGKNVIGLTTTHVRDWVQGVLYDYLRLELDESAKADALAEDNRIDKTVAALPKASSNP